MKDNRQVIVSLQYTPKAENLKKKLENLPVKYLRLNTKSNEELKLFEEAMNLFAFQFQNEDEDKRAGIEEPRNKKFKAIENHIPKKVTPEKKKKFKLLENRLIKPPSGTTTEATISEATAVASTSSPSQSFAVMYDDDADLFCSQKYHFE